MTMSEWVDVAAIGEFVESEPIIVDVDDTEVAVFKIGDRFYAIEDLCSHEEFTLTDGEVEGDTITCPAHGAKFCIRTGEALSAPAYEPVATFATRVENGIVQVRDERWA
jgi:3-phenylpropionate/trans-cinnamate dioxygenase ferredoxin subunit